MPLPQLLAHIPAVVVGRVDGFIGRTYSTGDGSYTTTPKSGSSAELALYKVWVERTVKGDAIGQIIVAVSTGHRRDGGSYCGSPPFPQIYPGARYLLFLQYQASSTAWRPTSQQWRVTLVDGVGQVEVVVSRLSAELHLPKHKADLIAQLEEWIRDPPPTATPRPTFTPSPTPTPTPPRFPIPSPFPTLTADQCTDLIIRVYDRLFPTPTSTPLPPTATATPTPAPSATPTVTPTHTPRQATALAFLLTANPKPPSAPPPGIPPPGGRPPPGSQPPLPPGSPPPPPGFLLAPQPPPPPPPIAYADRDKN